MKTGAEKANIREWLSAMDEASKGSRYQGLSRKLSKALSVPSRSRKAVSLFKINSNTEEGDNVIVPRKVLSTGALDHKVTIAALEYSGNAKEALKRAGCNVVSVKEMLGKEKIHIIL